MDIIGWHIAHVYDDSEAKVCASLRQLSLETWLPMCRIIRAPREGVKVRRRYAMSDGPLFPGYLFIKLPIPYRAMGIEQVRGVIRLLGVQVEGEQRPVLVPDQEVESLRSLLGRGETLIKDKRGQGDGSEWVYMDRGPWSGMFVRFDGTPTEHRVNKLLDICSGALIFRSAEA